ncbi:MAG: hypothetical protein PHT59_03060 [Candidatus Omnitrophica bacterium]|nr:hypothetical protein [Candidatus Omnitrophota bacterium]
MDRKIVAAIAALVCIGAFAASSNIPEACCAETAVETVVSTAFRDNPFLTREENTEFSEAGGVEGSVIPLEYLRLTAVFYSRQNSRSRAIINGRVLAQGDTVDDKEIVAINPEDVRLRDGQGKYIVKLEKLAESTAYVK